jgi:transposase
MERRLKVELFEELRREYEYGCGTIVGVAKTFGVHRRLVRQAIESALPPERKRAERRRPKFAAIREFIDTILKADEQAPRKQRHTAHRIYERLGFETTVVISERTVRQYVHERREQLGLYERVVMVPQAYEWGVEAQVDWYEAVVVLGGTRQNGSKPTTSFPTRP